MKRRAICVVTSGHISTCPRMLKAADAFAEAGYDVRVIWTRSTDWAAETDLEVERARKGAWRGTVVDYHRAGNRVNYWWSGLRFSVARRTVAALGPTRAPLKAVCRAYGRVHTELVEAALDSGADLYYGGTSGALAAVAEAGRRSGRPYALDLEDFHGTEAGDPWEKALAERVQRSVLPGARFLTAASRAIAEAYEQTYGVRVVTVNNVFPLPQDPPDPAPPRSAALRLYWFSQTIGPGRGLEDAVRACGLAGIPSELSLRGRAVPGYCDALRELARQVAPRLNLVELEPASPDAMVDLARGYDVGLAVEQPDILNRALSLSNKAFTYILAGLAVAFTDTKPQRSLATDLGEGALLSTPGDAGQLAAGLKFWAEHPAELRRAKVAAWQAAKRRWHWEHPEERGALLDAVARSLPSDVACASF